MKETKQKIIKYIEKRGPVSAKELTDYIGISKQAMFVHLKTLIEKDFIYKIGTPPKVFYILKEKTIDFEDVFFEEEIRNVIEDNFLFITPGGEIKEGTKAFIYWCRSNNLEPIKTGKDYYNTLKKYNK